jgi:hypothetical protein
MTTNNPAHGFGGRLSIKGSHTGRKPEATTKAGKCNPRLAKRRPNKKIAFLEMP